MRPQHGEGAGNPIDEPGIDLRRLRYFFAVCDHGGFSKAALAIGIAQPALTRHIKLLEQELGVTLIERSSRGAEPSLPGRFLLDRSRPHINDLNVVVRETRMRFSTSHRVLNIGICPTIASLFPDGLPTLLRRSHPDSAVTVIEAYNSDLRSLLHAGRLDLAVTYQQPEETGSTAIELLTERLVLVRAGARRGGAPVPLADLARFKLILPSKTHELRRLIDRASSACAIELEPALELDSLDAVKSILTEKPSCYATVLPYHCVQAEVTAKRLRRDTIDEPSMQRTVVVVVPSESSSPVFVKDVISTITAGVRKSTAPFARFIAFH